MKKQIYFSKNNNLNHNSGLLSDFSDKKAGPVLRFHTSLPQYCPTPLIDLRNLALHLGTKKIWLKDESKRFDLNAFKVLGASYAIAKLLADKLKITAKNLTFTKILKDLKNLKDLTFVTATDGNHGRAVAWTACKLGCKSIVYMPEGSSPHRLRAIQKYATQASIIDGNYDTAVKTAAEQAEKNNWILIQDTAWPGYELIPKHIMQGYMTLLKEFMQESAGEIPTHIFVQAGVGSLAAALAAYSAQLFGSSKPHFSVVEPVNSPCLFESNRKGGLFTIASTGRTMMAGLDCGTPSTSAWGILHDHADAFITCADEITAKGMNILANPLKNDQKIISGESGAVTTGLVYEVLSNPDYKEIAEELDLGKDAKVLLISTEGNTDPENYKKFV
ncbi:diaminopropionate ammonia-lyase [Candidatus Margulisiibacteriota bacterium]